MTKKGQIEIYYIVNTEAKAIVDGSFDNVKTALEMLVQKYDAQSKYVIVQVMRMTISVQDTRNKEVVSVLLAE